MSGVSRWLVLAATAALASAFVTLGAGAQRDASVTAPPETHTVAGRLLLGTRRGPRPLSGTFVVLHHIAADGSGPLDSMRTGADGRFRFRVASNGDGVHIVSARYAGIAYFSAPLGAASAPSADVVVFDTTSGPVPVAVRGRHVIISAPEGTGVRAVVEVFELANDSSLTRVAPAGGATFRAALPVAALRPRVGEGEIAAAAVSFAPGSMELRAPVAPGLKQLIVSYELPASAFPLVLRIGAPVTVLEVLAEETATRTHGGGLATRDAATVQGRQLQRWTAQDVDAAAIVTIEVPPVSKAAGRFTSAWIVAAVVVVLALLLGLLVGRRAPTGTTETPIEGSGATAEDFARRIAALDAAFEQRTSDALVNAYHEERATLKAHLTALLARAPSDR